MSPICDLKTDTYPLTSTERWVLVEVLRDLDDEHIERFIAKCEKNSLSLEQCVDLLRVFEIHDVDHALASRCWICRRLSTYSEAR